MSAPSDADIAAAIRERCMSGDCEGDHNKADCILIDLLRRLGFNETADAWDAVEKWYA